MAKYEVIVDGVARPMTQEEIEEMKVLEKVSEEKRKKLLEEEATILSLSQRITMLEARLNTLTLMVNRR